MVVGILALQGDYSLHSKILNDNNVENILVRDPRQLNEVNGLIIPGGESTVILKLLNKFNFIPVLDDFSKKKFIYGTCAGAIIMSSRANYEMKTLDYIEIESHRNFWGSQINSFIDNVNINFIDKPFKGYFIRAPKFKILDKKLDVLALYKDTPVLIRNNRHLVSSFHPEMTCDFSIHNYFIGMIKNEI